MYFCIHYFDNNAVETESNKTQSLSVETTKSSSIASAVIPENKQLLINPNCPVGILLDYMCKETGISKEADFDFCNVDTGEFVGIKKYEPFSYATDLFVPKQIYVIILFERDENGVLSKYVPYVNKLSKVYSEILIRIRRFSNASRTKQNRGKKYRRFSTAGSSMSNSETITSVRRGKTQSSATSRISSTPHK